jgi:hypothetical protein
VATPALIGTATLDQEVLIDDLVADVIDGLRDELNPEFGIRAYRVYRVIRTWSGTEPGDGTPSDVAGELRPYPRVKFWDGFRYQENPAGLNDVGKVQCTEVSLTYSAADLNPPLNRNQELIIAIVITIDLSIVGYFTHLQPPYIDREKDLGWSLNLIKVETPAAFPWQPS